MSNGVNKALITIGLFGAILGPLTYFSIVREPKMNEVALVNEDYGKDFLVYESKLGFSFKYPVYAEVMADPDAPRLYIISKDKIGKYVSTVVISAENNDEQTTPEQWLLGPTAGYDKQNKYFKTTIDGQDAVYIDAGMWVVVNTPDDKWRLSIASIDEQIEGIPLSEMDIIVESLKFSR